MEYNNLTTQEKALFSRVLNTKHELERAKKEHEKALAQVFELAKANGTLVKGAEKIVYTPASEYITVDVKRLQADNPMVLNEYGKQVNRKESVKCLIK